MSYFTRLYSSRFALKGQTLRQLPSLSHFAAKRNNCVPLFFQSHRYIQSIDRPFPDQLDSEIRNLVGPISEQQDGTLATELPRLYDSSPIEPKALTKMVSDSNLIEELLSHQRFAAASLIIVSLLKTHEIGKLLILDSCARLLIKGSIDEVNQILHFWSHYFRQDQVKSPSELNACSLAHELILIACNLGKPLAAASLCLRLDEAKLLDQEMLNLTVSLLLIPHVTQNQFNIKTIVEMYKRLKNTRLELTSDQKAQLLKLSRQLSYDKFPSMLNDTFNVVRKIPGGDVPIKYLFKMIKDNLLVNNSSRAALVTKELLKRNLPIDQYDLEVLGLMIREFSKNRKYQDIAHHLVAQVPEDYYTVEGLTEVLLSFCARTKNQELAVTIYSKLEAPIPRSVLTSLLHLHISFGDNEGAEKILLEIARRNDAIQPVEFSMIVQVALQQSLEKAVDLARKNSPHVAKLAYGSIINEAIEQDNMDVADEFIDLAYENLSYNDHVFDTISTLIIKRILKKENSREARLQWLQWKSGAHASSKIRLPRKGAQIISLRAIADKAMAEGDVNVMHWAVQELRHLGMHMDDIRKELSRRSKAKQVPSAFLNT